MEELFPKYDDAVVIAANSSDEYVPYLSVYLLAIKEKSSPNHNYDIVILENSISETNKEILKNLIETDKNFSLRFYNPSELFDLDNLEVTHLYLCKESYFRLAAPVIFKNYKRLIFTDVDLIFNKDPYELYTMDMNNKLLLSAIEPIWSQYINLDMSIHDVNIKDYAKNQLKLKNIRTYYNTGVMLLDIEKLNQYNATDKFIEKTRTEQIYLYQDQCIINEVLQDEIGVLPFEWNMEILHQDVIKDVDEDIKKYINIKEPNVIHFLGRGKPWLVPERPYSEKWWYYARKSPYYEIIINRNSRKYTDLKSFNLNEKFNTKSRNNSVRIKKLQKEIKQQNQTIESLLCVINMKKNKSNFFKYKLLKNFVSGERKLRYKEKELFYKEKIEKAKSILNK